jgi:hypothetical protein
VIGFCFVLLVAQRKWLTPILGTKKGAQRILDEYWINKWKNE